MDQTYRQYLMIRQCGGYNESEVTCELPTPTIELFWRAPALKGGSLTGMHVTRSSFSSSLVIDLKIGLLLLSNILFYPCTSKIGPYIPSSIFTYSSYNPSTLTIIANRLSSHKLFPNNKFNSLFSKFKIYFNGIKLTQNFVSFAEFK
jgi:hypothetical protein